MGSAIITLKKPSDFSLLIRYVHKKNGTNVWLVRSFELMHRNPNVTYKWGVQLEHILEEVKQIYQRPKRLLAFVNPYGGSGKAIKINNSIVQPLLNLCHVECQVIGKEHAQFDQSCSYTKLLRRS